MKIGIRFGHMESGADAGAVGILKETDVNREYGAHVITYLMRAGHEVINCTPKTATSLSDSLCQGVDMANNNNCDLFISLHVNACGGEGCEVLYFGNSEPSKDLASHISDSISTKCNYHNRGAKADVRGLYELKHTNMPAVIVEPFFLDNTNDCAKYNADKIALAIVEGILAYIGVAAPVYVEKPHFGQAPYDYLNSRGIIIRETNFDKPMTRAEVFVLLAESLGWKP